MSEIGPTAGALLGVLWGEQANQRDFELERARLREQLKEATKTALGEQAIKDATKAVLNAVVSELQAEEAGQLKVRRLSDPANRKDRCEAFMDTAEGQLRRLSENKLGFSQTSTEVVKAARREVSEVLKDEHARPKVVKRG